MADNKKVATSPSNITTLFPRKRESSSVETSSLDSRFRGNDSGFTLVEIVISLTVLSLIVLGTLTAMRTLSDTYERLGDTTDRVDEMRQVSQFLRNTLEQMRGSTMADTSSGWGMVYRDSRSFGPVRSEPGEIVWMAPLDSIQGISGMSYIRLYREGDLLKVQFLPEYLGGEEIADFAWDQLGDGHVLASGVEEFSIAYRPFAGAGWQDNLAEDAGMPDAVNITIKAKGRYWPEILVAPYGASG